MPLVNDGYGCVREEANPHTGTAELFWRPLDPLRDNANAKGAESPDWNEGDSSWAYQSVLTLTAKEWAYDEKVPFSWYVTTRPATTLLRGLAGNWANVETTLCVFVAPHVEVKRASLSLGYWFKAPDIRIVRVDSIYEVPLPGREPNLGQLLGSRPTLEYFNGRLSAGDLLDEVNKDAVFDSDDPLSIPDIRIIRNDLSIIIEKPGSYQIKITLSEEKPSLFRITILFDQKTRDSSLKLPPGWEDYSGDQSLSREEAHRTLFRIIHDANTRVEFRVAGPAKAGLTYVRAKLETRKIWHKPKTEQRPVNPVWAREDGAQETVQTIVEDHFADPYYYDFESGKWAEMDPDADWYGIDTLFQLGIGFVPVLGQLYDIADITSVAMTGEDLWGVKKSNTDIVLMGGFALFGVLGDLSKHVDIGVMTRIGDYLFPNYKVVSNNPNFPRFLVRAAFSGTPSFTHAGEVLAKKKGAAYMREMDALIQAGDKAGLESLARTIENELGAIMRSNAESIPFKRQPATLAILRENRERFAVMLRNHEAIPASTIDEVMKVWETGHINNTLSDLLDTIQNVNSAAATVLLDGLRNKIIDDVNADPVIIRRASSYVARYGKKSFFAKHSLPFSPYTYLTRVTKKGTEAREAFDLKYGKEAWLFMTKRKAPADLDMLIARYKNQISELMNGIDTYFNHRKMIQDKFPGLGLILNSDHILEARFRKLEAYPGSVDSDMFRAILVPPNLEVARKLRAEGIDIGWYIHQHKTSRMNQLLPQRETDYTIEEIADAYQLFWVNEMKMSPSMFRNLFEEEFQFLDMARKGTHVVQGVHNPNAGKIIFTRFKSRETLLRLINARLKKMALPKFVEEKIGNRVSNAPGLG